MTEKEKNAKTKRAVSLQTIIVPSIGAALFYLINFVIMGVATWVLGFDRLFQNYGAVVLLIAVVLCVCLYLMARILDRSNEHHRIYRFKPTLGGLFSSVVIAFGLLGFSFFYMSVVSALSNYFPFIERSLSEYAEIMGFVDRLSTTQFILSSIATVFIVPIAEELLFRGIILHEFLKAMPPWVAIVFSSIIFALIHYQPVQVGYAFACGIVIGVAYYFSKSIYLPIIIHIIFNFFGGPFYRIFEVSDGILNVIFILQVLSFFTMFIVLVYIRKEGNERTLSGVST